MQSRVFVGECITLHSQNAAVVKTNDVETCKDCPINLEVVWFCLERAFKLYTGNRIMIFRILDINMNTHTEVLTMVLFSGFPKRKTGFPVSTSTRSFAVARVGRVSPTGSVRPISGRSTGKPCWRRRCRREPQKERSWF